MAQALLDSPRPRRIEGVVEIDGKALRAQRIVTLILTLLPFAGFAYAVVSLWGTGLRGLDVALFGGMYAVTGLGITVGFHRYFAHKSFVPRPAVRVALAVVGSMALEGSVISWAATHRRHHAYSDRPGDPHSPHLEEARGVVGALKGLWFAHTGWLFAPERTSHERWAPDLLKDRAIARVDRLFPVLVVISLSLPAVLGFALTGTLRGAIGGFVWGGLARVFLLHHITWSINSICHFFGTKPLRAQDESRNNWPLSVLSFGESWHNNHHAFPSSAWLGLRPHQVDLGGYAIWILHRLRLVRDVRRPSPEQIRAKRV